MYSLGRVRALVVSFEPCLDRSAILITVKENRGQRGPSEQQIERAVYFFKPTLVVDRREFGFKQQQRQFYFSSWSLLVTLQTSLS